MNKYNSVFLLVTLSAAIISFNTRAAEHGMITLNQNSGNLQPISPLVLLAAENGVLPSFEVQHLANSYNRYGNKVKIEFTMSSEQLINYYIYITNSTGLIIMKPLDLLITHKKTSIWKLKTSLWGIIT